MPLLRNPSPPRLPDPEGVYSARFMGSLLGVLRQYFGLLTASLQTLFGLRGATYLGTTYGSVYSTADQTAANTTTAYVVSFDSVYVLSGVALTSGTRLVVDSAGVYLYTVSLQFGNTNAALHRAYIWFRVNGVDVPQSRSNISVTATHGGQPGHMAIELTMPLTLSIGDYVELVWSVENTDVFLEALPTETSPTRPAVPSAIATLHFISALPT